MTKAKKIYSSLAQFVVSKREELGLSQEDLSEKSSLTIEQIQSIEQGLDLFLPSTIRQKLAKGLKVDNKEIKLYEVKTDFTLSKNAQMDSIREAILLNSQNPNFVIECPVCALPILSVCSSRQRTWNLPPPTAAVR